MDRYRATPAVTWDFSFFRSHPKDRYSIASYDTQRDAEDISNPDPHGSALLGSHCCIFRQAGVVQTRRHHYLNYLLGAVIKWTFVFNDTCTRAGFHSANLG
jgi:hypothetical protein